MRRLAFAVAALGLCACTTPRTEMVVVVQTEGVRVPADVHRLHFTVDDRGPSGDEIVYETDVELCHAGLAANCFDLPVSAVLFPGKTRPNDTVRVQVDAIGSNNQKVIGDAAIFTFADQQSLRLDFVLYGNCLGNVECEKRDQACGPLDTCVSLNPVTLHGEPDLAPTLDRDLSMETPRDMTAVDLAGADLFMPPPDLTTVIDMAGCSTVLCPMGQICVAPGTCTACGGLNQPCCVGPTATRPGASAQAGGALGGACNQPNLTCNGSTCEHCGQPTQLCCTGQNPDCFNSFCDSSNHCQMMMSPPDFMMAPPPDMSLMTGGPDLF